MNNETQTQASNLQRSLLRDTRGLSTVEYVILMAIVVIGAIGTWNNIGTKFKGKLVDSNTDIQTLGD